MSKAAFFVDQLSEAMGNICVITPSIKIVRDTSRITENDRH